MMTLIWIILNSWWTDWVRKMLHWRASEEDDNNSDGEKQPWLKFCPCFHLGLDGDRQTDGTDTSRRRDTRSSAGHQKSEDTSDSREDDAIVSAFISFSFRPSCFMTPHRTALLVIACRNEHVEEVSCRRQRYQSRIHHSFWLPQWCYKGGNIFLPVCRYEINYSNCIWSTGGGLQGSLTRSNYCNSCRAQYIIIKCSSKTKQTRQVNMDADEPLLLHW